jgi:hypothetical protein
MLLLLLLVGLLPLLLQVAAPHPLVPANLDMHLLLLLQ